jgi:hypothetical protein
MAFQSMIEQWLVGNSNLKRPFLTQIAQSLLSDLIFFPFWLSTPVSLVKLPDSFFTSITIIKSAPVANLKQKTATIAKWPACLIISRCAKLNLSRLCLPIPPSGQWIRMNSLQRCDLQCLCRAIQGSEPSIARLFRFLLGAELVKL